MRTGTSIDKEAAIAIYLPLLDSVLSEEEKRTMMKAKLCQMGRIDARDLLAPGKGGNSITKSNSKRKKCVLVYLSKLSIELTEAIKKGALA